MSPRDCQIVAALKGGNSIVDIAAQFGASRDAIRNIMNRHGVGTRRRAGPRPKQTESGPISPLAHRVAQRFYRWRAIENDYTPAEAAKLIGVTLPRACKLERGCLPLTLPELERLAAAMGMTPSELLA